MGALGSMNLKAVGGLDGWVPTALKGLTKFMCETLAYLYDHISYVGHWPSSTSVVRTQLIPKHAEAYLVSEQRPLSILSIWYRLWSRAALIAMGPELQQALNPHLRGGIPNRAIDDSILNWALQIENTVHGMGGIDGRDQNEERPTGLCLVTLDAVKCFDNISQPQVLAEALRAGVPANIVRCLSAFYQRLTRVLTYGGFVDMWSYHPSVGVPQGCALSAYLCNVLVSGWADRIGEVAVPEAYLDDRTIYAKRPEDLGDAWGGGLPREGVVVEEFVPSLESLSSLGLEERNLGCPGNVAGMSQTPGGVQKVCAKKSSCAFFCSLTSVWDSDS